MNYYKTVYAIYFDQQNTNDTSRYYYMKANGQRYGSHSHDCRDNLVEVEGWYVAFIIAPIACAHVTILIYPVIAISI